MILDSTCFEKQEVTVRSDLDPGEVQDLGRDRSWVLALARLAQVPGDTFSCNQQLAQVPEENFSYNFKLCQMPCFMQAF